MSEVIPIASLNQYTFCPRRCFLMYVEQVYTDNQYTLEGSFSHEHADLPGSESRPGVRIERALPLYSDRLELSGKADIVEFRQIQGKEQPYPVDYKRGKKKKWTNDEVQLCAQALCLEDMLGIPVPEGAIYHIRSKRRRCVPFSSSLRALTIDIIGKVKKLLRTAVIPPISLRPACKGCSLEDLCLPEVSSFTKNGKEKLFHLD